jgi:hypothetical protein
MLGMKVLSTLILVLISAAAGASDPYPGYDYNRAITEYVPYFACVADRAKAYAHAQSTTATEVAIAAESECGATKATSEAGLRDYTIHYNQSVTTAGMPLDLLNDVTKIMEKKAHDGAISIVVTERLHAAKPHR